MVGKLYHKYLSLYHQIFSQVLIQRKSFSLSDHHFTICYLKVTKGGCGHCQQKYFNFDIEGFAVTDDDPTVIQYEALVKFYYLGCLDFENDKEDNDKWSGVVFDANQYDNLNMCFRQFLPKKIRLHKMKAFSRKQIIDKYKFNLSNEQLILYSLSIHWLDFIN